MVEHLPLADTYSAYPASPRRLRFNIRSLLWLFLAVALTLACLLQTRKLNNAERALARNEWAGSTGSLPAGKFRLMMNPLLEYANQKVYVWRVEFSGQHWVTTGRGTSLSTPVEGSDTEWVEVMVFVNYDPQTRRLTTLERTKSNGASSGTQFRELRDGKYFDNFLEIQAKPGVYDIGQPIELYREDGKPVQLIVK